jgi:acyl transferase domain-containing protein/thioesterase domain-containing protein
LSADADRFEGAIAITGMAGRFAGARDTDELWDLMASGREGIADLSDADLLAAGVGLSDSSDPEYVRRSGDLADTELFDAARFGIAPSEAALIDPQIRHLLELAWETLESGTHRLDQLRDGVGVYVGVGYNTYLARNLLSHADILRDIGWFGLRHLGNDKDFAATTLAYRLDLRGPALSVQTACSTSLTAVHLAVQALLAFECDVALAGAASIEVPVRAGYRYVAGEVLSADGFCRPFDAGATGTVLSSGAGLVTLRRYADALGDNDPILAVLRGTAINNDGQRKVSYFAPSVEGQVDVVREALSVAGIPASSVTLIEAHGTGTALGDPIEFAALSEALDTRTRHHADTFAPLPAIGSIKANIGHTDTAAGIAGLIKVVESLRRQTITPQANFVEPNPLIDLPGTGLRIVTKLEPWDAPSPRRAGVTSLGVGGTNAHVIVEEFAGVGGEVAGAPGAEPSVVMISAPTAASLRNLVERVATTISTPAPTLPTPGQVAATFALGRTVHTWRTAIIGSSTDELRRSLAAAKSTQASEPARVLFLFPGAGPQRSGMISELLVTRDARFRAFKEAVEQAVSSIDTELDLHLGDLLRSGPDNAIDERFRDPEVGLPALFVAEYALSRQLVNWGVVPAGVLGHSMGEHAAAVAAGAATLTDAVIGIGARAEAIANAARSTTPGRAAAAMIAVFAPESELRRHLSDSLDLAVVNGPDELVYSGPLSEIELFERALHEANIDCRRVNLAAAAHFRGLDPELDLFRARLNKTTHGRPEIAFYSTQAGGRFEGALDASYWVSELRGTVRFADAVRAAAAEGPFLGIEVAPGKVLSAAVRALEPSEVMIPILGGSDTSAVNGLLHGVSQLWCHGGRVDSTRLVDASLRRVRLPVPRLDRRRAWIDPMRATALGPLAVASGANASPGTGGSTLHDTVVSAPTWTPLVARASAAYAGVWLLDAEPDDQLVAALSVALGVHGVQLVNGAQAPDTPITGALLVRQGSADPMADVAGSLVWRTAQAANQLFERTETGVGRVAVITVGAWPGPRSAAVHPGLAAAAGVVGVLAQEYPGLAGLALDLPSDFHYLADGSDENPERCSATVSLVIELLLDPNAQGVVRVVHDEAQQRTWTTVADSAVQPAIAGHRGSGLVIGGLGHVGSIHAAALLEGGCDVVVTTRSELPEDESTWLEKHGPSDPQSQRLRRFVALKALARETDRKLTLRVVDVGRAIDLDALLRTNEYDTIVHAVGVLHDRLLAQLTETDVDAVLSAKLMICEQLVEYVERRPNTVVQLVGSASTSLGIPGQAAYIAANAVVEALAGSRGSSWLTTIAWGRFGDGGMAVTPAGIGATKFAHPFFSAREVLNDGSIVVSGSTLPAWTWVLDEHRIAGRAVLPATAHIALMFAVLGGDASRHIVDVTIIEPLLCHDDVVTEVRAVLDPPDREIRAIRIEARTSGQASWTLHSQAIVAGQQADGTHVGSDVGDLRMPEISDYVSVDVFRNQSRSLVVGPHWDADVQMSAGRDFGRIVLGTNAVVHPSWIVHPAALDLSLALGLEGSEGAVVGFWVPAQFDSVEVFRPVEGAFDVEIRRRDVSADVVRFDLRLVDANGILGVFRGCELRRVHGEWTGASATVTPAMTASRARSALISRQTAHDDAILVTVGEPEHLSRNADSPPVFGDLVVTGWTPDQGGTPTGTIESEANGAEDLQRLTLLWRDVLGDPNADEATDFFGAGGHSLLGLRLVARIRRELGGAASLPMLVMAPSPQAFALLRSPEQAIELSVAITLREGGNSTFTPLHMVHGAGGNLVGLRLLAQAFLRDRSVYGYQANWVIGGVADSTIAAMAQRYASRLVEVQPNGPFFLAGYSGGGVIALEMAEELRKLGRDVVSVILLDTVPPRGFNPPIRVKLRNVVRNLLRHGPIAVMPWARGVVDRKLFRRARAMVDDLQDSSTEAAAELDFKRAYARHEMPVYNVDVLLARAATEWPAYPEGYGLAGHISGTFKVRDAPGDHFSMIAPTNLPQLAALLESHIESNELQRRNKHT